MEKKNKLYAELLKEVSDSTGILGSIYINIRMDILKDASKGKYSFELKFNNYLEKGFSDIEENIIFNKLRQDGFNVPLDMTINSTRHFYRSIPNQSPSYTISWEM